MQQIFHHPSFRGTGADASALNVAIIYEDFEAGKQAKRTYDFLVQELGHETQFTSSMWKFDVLAIPKLSEIAAKDAAMADIVIVASHGGHEMPLNVQKWAEHWLALRGNTTALVALFDCSMEQSLGVRSYLENLARRGNLEFFVQPEDKRARQLETTEMDSVPRSAANRTLSILADAMGKEASIPRWGINE